MIDTIVNDLIDLMDNGQTKEIKDAAKSYLDFYQSGDLGSNSPGLIFFIKEPIKYTEQWGSMILGVI